MNDRSVATPMLVAIQFVCLGLVVAVVSLTPAAHASPADQSWIPGLYDNADFDDVVLLITSHLGGIQPSLLWTWRLVDFLIGLVTPMAAESWPPQPLSSVLSRAPPLA